MATLTLKNVKKRFGQTDVIHGVDLDVSDGEFIVIVGPSGCGKSTLLRMVAGLEEPTEGDIFIKGVRINDTPIHKRNLGMIFQNYALFPHKNIFEKVTEGVWHWYYYIESMH